jgi:hypothetical protein
MTDAKAASNPDKYVLENRFIDLPLVWPNSLPSPRRRSADARPQDINFH